VTAPTGQQRRRVGAVKLATLVFLAVTFIVGEKRPGCRSRAAENRVRDRVGCHLGEQDPIAVMPRREKEAG
jgi:hypothetical protein